MKDKGRKYDLSYFTLDGGATGSKRAEGKGKSRTGKHKGKTSKSFDESPEDPDPNSRNNHRYLEDLREGLGSFSSKEQRKFDKHSAVYPKFLMPKIDNPDEMM